MKDLNLTYTSQANDDIRSILEFIAEDDPEAALRVIDAIEHSAKALASDPGIGFRPTFLNHPKTEGILCKVVTRFRRYLIFYKIFGNDLKILRVRHSSMENRAVFEPEED